MKKKTGNKINGGKKDSQKGKTHGKQWTCPFAFFWHVLCFLFPGKKQKTRRIEKTHFFSILFFAFCLSFFFTICFPFILLVFFLDFADLLFGFPFFIYGIFFSVFSSLLILKISNGLVNISVVIFQTPFLQVLWCSMFIWGSVNGLSRVNPLIIGFMNSYYISGMNHQVSKQVISIELPDWTAYYFTYAVHWHHWRIERFDPQEQHGI